MQLIILMLNLERAWRSNHVLLDAQKECALKKRGIVLKKALNQNCMSLSCASTSNAAGHEKIKSLVSFFCFFFSYMGMGLRFKGRRSSAKKSCERPKRLCVLVQ